MEGNIKWKPVGDKTRSIASLRGKIVLTIGKFAGIMGGRIQFAPRRIRKILKILIQNPGCKQPQKPTKTSPPNSVKSINP